MLKFIKHHLDTIAGVGIYPVISFVIFFSFFLLMLFWLRRGCCARRSYGGTAPFRRDQHQ
ncbi:MAG: CcoQ/FixQ family Cbb3-type cytochrome c oxidase assembly chaperone [Flavobacteriales bacterium]|nr:CcoQ/FixQ family Cbb3-type cytochrome c oxidase assembly chaperone [Flavobacteriales bacterium]